MGNCLKNLKCCHNQDRESIPILILGLKNSGKTDIAFRLINKKREDFHPTNGCRIFSTKFNKRLIKFTELGGEFYDIWKYYFLDVFGIIYVIDSSDHSQLERSKDIFGSIMSNDLLMGKPMLILSNKQDKPGSLDSLDICDYFEIEYLANLFRTPCYVEGIGKTHDRSYDAQVTINALQWLVSTICKNYKSIQNKIRFLRVVTQNESLSSNEEIPRNNRRPATGKRKKKLRFSKNRPKTAPNTKASVKSDTRSFLTSPHLPSTLRSKKSNQVSPMCDSFSLRFNYDVACERHIREGLKAGLINGIITVSEMTEKSHNQGNVIVVEDLSLSSSNHQEVAIS